MSNKVYNYLSRYLHIKIKKKVKGEGLNFNINIEGFKVINYVNYIGNQFNIIFFSFKKEREREK